MIYERVSAVANDNNSSKQLAAVALCVVFWFAVALGTLALIVYKPIIGVPLALFQLIRFYRWVTRP